VAQKINPQNIPGLNQPSLSRIPSAAVRPSIGDFQRILDQKISGELKFSAHAQQRLQSRNIRLTPQEIAGLKDALGKAEAKGAKESLVVMDRVALVVSIKNRTVITAVDGHSMKDNVFTQIDSAVIVRD
jgi:flagellar operon protein